MNNLKNFLITASSARIPGIKTSGTSHIPMNLDDSVKALLLALLVQASSLQELIPLLLFATSTSLLNKKSKSHTPKWFERSIHKKRIPTAPVSLLVAKTLPPWRCWHSHGFLGTCEIPHQQCYLATRRQVCHLRRK